METEKCKIKLDSPESIYFAGQQIKGEISINLTKKTKIRGICFRVQGHGKCSWYELLRRDSQGIAQAKGNQRSRVYTSHESYLEYEVYVVGSKSARPIELDVGTHTYPFSYQLQPNLPSSFSGSYGCIKYKLKFTIEKAWNFDDKYTVPITIVKAHPLCRHNINRSPIIRQTTRNIGVFGGGPVSLITELPRSEVVRGGKLILRVTVDNKSNTHVEKLKFSIRQSIRYFSQQPFCVQKEEILKIYKKETGGVLKKTERTFEHELQVPSCQPTDHSNSKIIFISYIVHVDVVLPALYKNITVILPFEVCSHEVNILMAQHSSIGWNTMYPSPNTSAYSIPSFDQSMTSPSHSYTDTLRRDSSNRSSISSACLPELPSSYPTSTTRSSRMSGTNLSDELPPSYDELFGNLPKIDKNVPSAPPLDTPNE